MPVSSDKMKVLFDAVSSSYDIGTIDEFKTKMQDPAKRKAFYNGIGKEYDLGESLDVFEGKLGFKKKDGGVSPVAQPEVGGVASPKPQPSALPSVSTEPPKKLTYSDINAKIEEVSKLQKQKKDVTWDPENEYKPLAVQEQELNAIQKKLDIATKEKNEVLGQYSKEISRAVESLIERGEYKNYFTPSGAFDYGKAKQYFTDFTKKYGGGGALIEHWVAGLKARGQGEIERAGVEPIYKQTLKSMGLEKYADPTKYAESVYQSVATKNQSQYDLVVKDRDRKAESLLTSTKSQVDALTQQFNQSVSGLNEGVTAGQLDPIVAKEEYDRQRAAYEKSLSDLDRQYRNGVSSINKQSLEKYGRIKSEVDKVAADPNLVMNSIPKQDREKIDQAYQQARNKYLSGRESVQKIVGESGGFTTMAGLGVASSFMSAIASYGDALASNGYQGKLVDWMQSKRTSAEELKPAQYEWSKDPMKRAITSAAQSMGGSLPTLGASIGIMAATRGSAAGIVASALTSYFGENTQNSGQVYRDVLERTGDVSLARKSADDYMRLVGKTLPLYVAGAYSDKLITLGKGFKSLVKGFGLELLEEVPVETVQSRSEAVLTQGYKGSDIQYGMENPELYLDIAAGVIGQSSAMKVFGLALNGVGKNVPASGTQTFADAVMNHGEAFALRLAQTQFDQGIITEQERDGLIANIKSISGNLAKLDGLGVRGDAAKLHIAMGKDLESLRQERAQEKDESIRSVLDDKIKKKVEAMSGILTGKAEFIVFGLPGDVNSKTMLAEDFNALPVDEQEQMIRNSKTITAVNNDQLNTQLQDRKLALGNPEGAPDGAYNENATVQSTIQQQEGRPEGGVQERPGVDGGQQEVGQGAGQQGQAPVEVADTGDSVRQGEGQIIQPTEQETALAGELGRELRTEYMPIVEKAAQALSASKVQFEVLDDAEFNARTGQSAEGAFISTDKEGKILLNRQKMEEADPGVIIWHEASHPVMNIMRNTNKPLYDKVVSGLKKLAAKTDSLALSNAIEFGGQYADAIRKAGGTEEEAMATADDEAIVEVIAQIAADQRVLSTLPVSMKQSLIDFINNIAKMLGIKARISDTDAATFKRVAGEVAAALKEGRDISEIVGAENVMRYENSIAQSYAESSESADSDRSVDFDTPIQLSTGGRESGPQPSGWLKKEMIIGADEIPNYKISKVIFYDNTKVGKIELKNRLNSELVTTTDGMGGFGYSHMQPAVDTGSVLAFTNIASAIQLVNRVLLHPDAVMAVAMQSPLTAHLGNVTTKNVLWGPTGQFALAAKTEEQQARVVSILKENIDRLLSVSKNKTERSALSKLLDKIPSVKTIPDVLNEIMTPSAFGIRNILHTSMLQSKPTKLTKGTRDSHVFLHYELGIPTLSEIADAMSDDHFKNAETGDIVKYVKPFAEKVIYTTSQDLFNQYKNKKLKDGFSLKFLDGMPNHESYPVVIRGENIGIGEKYFGVNDVFDAIRKTGKSKSASFYTAGRTKADAPTGQIPAGSATYGGPSNVQYSLGNRTSPEYKQRANVASDNLVRIFQRNNVPLTKDEAIEIVDDLRDWTDWYDGLASYVGGIFGEYADDVLSLLPLSSQGNNSSGTVALAINNAERVYAGETPVGLAEYKGHITKFLGGMGIESDKMSNFFKAIFGDPKAIAVDMHVWSIIKGRDPNKKAVNPKDPKQFEAAKQFVNAVSEAMGVEPRGVQAALWAANILRTGGKPDSYEQYFANQVVKKGLTERINGWRDKGYQPFTPARKQRQQQTGVQLSIGGRKPEGPERYEYVKSGGKYYPKYIEMPDGFAIVQDSDNNEGWGYLYDQFDRMISGLGEVRDHIKEIEERFPVGTPELKNATAIDVLSNIDRFTPKQFAFFMQKEDPMGFYKEDYEEIDKQENAYKAGAFTKEYLASVRRLARDFFINELQSYGADTDRGYDIPADGLGIQKLPADIQLSIGGRTEPTVETGEQAQMSAYQRPESKREFKLVSFVLRKKAEGYTDAQIAFAINSALPNLTPQEVLSIINNPRQYLMNAFPGMTSMQHENLYKRAQIANIYRQRSFMPRSSDLSMVLSVGQDFLDRVYVRERGRAETYKDAVERFVKAKFVASKGLEKWTLLAKESAQGFANLQIARAKKTLDLLGNEAKKIDFQDWELFGEALTSFGSQDGVTEMSLAPYAPVPLAGLTLAPRVGAANQIMQRLPEEIRPFVYRMRDQIDGLSRMIITGGFANPVTALTIQKNLGLYTTRAYRLFTESLYKPSIEVANAAIKFLADEEYNILVKEYLRVARAERPAVSMALPFSVEPEVDYGSIPTDDLMKQASEKARKTVDAIINRKDNPYFRGTSIGSRDVGIFKNRKSIPLAVRRLMGEYTDPGIVFMMTVVKQSALAASSQYLTELREKGMGTLFYEKNDPNRPIGYDIEVASEGSKTLEPLNGLMTTKDVYNALNDIPHTYGWFMQYWMKAVGYVRVGKTVLSPRTQVVNFESNLAFAVINGLVFTKDGVPFSRAMGEAWRYTKGQYSDTELSEITEKVIGLKLVGQDLDVGAVREAFKDNDMFGIAMDVALSERGIFNKKVKKIRPFSAFEKAYRMGDDFWKVYGYISERTQISDLRHGKKYEELTPAVQRDVDLEAADRVKDTWPTFDRMFKAVRELTQGIPVIGNFLPFKAETMRVLANTIKLIRKDLKDPQMKPAAYRRLLGVGMYITIRTGVKTGQAALLGYGVKGLIGLLKNDPEDEEKKWALNEIGPKFMRNGEVVSYQNKDKPHIYTMVDLSSLDPFSFTSRATNALTEGSGSTEPGMGAFFSELIGGFFEPEMTFDTVEDIRMNYNSDTNTQIYNEEDVEDRKFEKILAYAFKKLGPSAVGLVERAMENENKAAEFSGFFGLRPYEVDLHKSYMRSLTKMEKSIQQINSEYGKVKLNEKSTEAEIEQARIKADSKKKRVVQKYHDLKRALVKLGANPEVLDEIISEKSPVKVTGMDSKTKGALKYGIDGDTSFY